MARDNIVPFLSPFSHGTKKNDEPLMAICFTWFLVQMLLFVGDLNAIVPFISMLTLLVYGIINLACFLLKISAAPNFRPRFTYFHWSTALLGFVGCFLAMYIVSVADAAISTIVMIAVWIGIHFYAPPKSWGEIQQALIYHQVRCRRLVEELIPICRFASISYDWISGKNMSNFGVLKSCSSSERRKHPWS